MRNIRRIGAWIAPVGLSMMIATPAFADPELGSRIKDDHSRDSRAYSEGLAARTARELVICLLAHDVTGAQAMLTTGDKDQAEKSYRSLLGWSVNSCNMLGEASPTSDEVAFNIPRDVFRGLVAERLVLKRITELAALPPLPVQMTYSRPWFALSGRDDVVNEMAVCLAETDPSDTAALFRTNPYSTQEMTAIQSLAPAMQKCLRVGVQLHANRQTLRAALAEGAFNRLLNPVTPLAIPVAHQ